MSDKCIYLKHRAVCTAPAVHAQSVHFLRLLLSVYIFMWDALQRTRAEYYGILLSEVCLVS